MNIRYYFPYDLANGTFKVTVQCELDDEKWSIISSGATFYGKKKKRITPNTYENVDEIKEIWYEYECMCIMDKDIIEIEFKCKNESFKWEIMNNGSNYKRM